MRQKTIKYFLGFALFLFTACNVEIPGEIIQPTELEALLYDYHLVQVMSTEAEGGEYKRRLYANFIFDKHNVSKEHFDSSMMWYARNPKYLHSIYMSLYDKLDAEVAQLAGEKYLTKAERELLNRDTVNLWIDENIFLMSSSPFMNRRCFAYDADTTFVDGDSISFAAGIHFISPDKSSNATVHLALVVEYKDNTYSSTGTTVVNDGYYSLELPRNPLSGIKKLSGHIYYMPSDSVADERLLVGNISLLRIHPPVSVEE